MNKKDFIDEELLDLWIEGYWARLSDESRAKFLAASVDCQHDRITESDCYARQIEIFESEFADELNEVVYF